MDDLVEGESSRAGTRKEQGEEQAKDIRLGANDVCRRTASEDHCRRIRLAS